jgi:hypothetical protein
MTDERSQEPDERDPVPQSESDRPVHGDKLKDPKSAEPTKKDLPPRTYDMDQPGMDPDDNDTA